ncbi:endocuticle structural glycoprotein SgAbd-2-like [Arctopsyche grandis]|uniref:endocuticle structural glycoprotein SgAbd-2-like n=1 Tax=Arctopsyche grandis TaxID=121162 RepID=UPI00406D7DDB
MSTCTLLLLVVGVVACSAGRLENTYLPPNSAQSAGGNGAFLAAPSSAFKQPGFGSSGAYRQPQGGSAQGSYSGGYSQGGKTTGQEIPILKFNNDNNGDGNYAFSYETANGIKAEETGHAQGESQAVQGGFAYTGPDGSQYSISYTADENGFRPVGAHIPTPPPIPEEILRALEQNERDEANGIVDDGSYKPDFSGSAPIAQKANFGSSGYHY